MNAYTGFPQEYFPIPGLHVFSRKSGAQIFPVIVSTRCVDSEGHAIFIDSRAPRAPRTLNRCSVCIVIINVTRRLFSRYNALKIPSSLTEILGYDSNRKLTRSGVSRQLEIYFGEGIELDSYSTHKHKCVSNRPSVYLNQRAFIRAIESIKTTSAG